MAFHVLGCPGTFDTDGPTNTHWDWFCVLPRGKVLAVIASSIAEPRCSHWHSKSRYSYSRRKRLHSNRYSHYCQIGAPAPTKTCNNLKAQPSPDVHNCNRRVDIRKHEEHARSRTAKRSTAKAEHPPPSGLVVVICYLGRA